MPRLCIVNVSGNIAAGKTTLIEHCNFVTGNHRHNWDVILKYPEPVEDWNLDLKRYYDAMETGVHDRVIEAAIGLQLTIKESYNKMYKEIREKLFDYGSLLKDVLVIIERGSLDAARVFIPTIMDSWPFMDPECKDKLLEIQRKCVELDRFLRSDMCLFRKGKKPIFFNLTSWRVYILTRVDVCLDRCNNRTSPISVNYLGELDKREREEANARRPGTIILKPKPQDTPEELADGLMFILGCRMIPDPFYLPHIHTIVNRNKDEDRWDIVYY